MRDGEQNVVTDADARDASGASVQVVLLGAAGFGLLLMMLRLLPAPVAVTLTAGGFAALLLGATDIHTHRLPNWATGGLALIGLAAAVVLQLSGQVSSIWPAVAGGAGFAVIGLLEALPAGSIGGGDAKLLGALGVWSGLLEWPGLLPTVLVSHLVMIGVLLVGRARTRNGARMVLGPAVAVGAIAGWILTAAVVL